MTPAHPFSHYPSWPLPLTHPTTITPRQPCGYLPDKLSTFRAFDADHLSGDQFQHLMDSGFRRSGSIVYQPMCAGCRQCIPIRVPVDRFLPSKSQRRVLKKNHDLLITSAPPEPSREKWDLYQRYQRDWHHKPTSDEDLLSFIEFLYRSPVDTLEFEYKDPWGTLLGVGICDLCPTSISSVYFYFDPRHAHRSLGTYSALYELQWTRDHHRTHWYAGYWIAACPAMAYKSHYRPCQTLSTDGTWHDLP